MKKSDILILLASLVLVAGIIVTGCVQDNSSNSGQSAAGTGQPSGSPAGGSPQQYRGAGMFSNITALTAAADKLGVSEQDLQNALDSTKNATSGRPNLTAAAQQLGVTRQQLSDAFGMQAGGRMRNGGYNATQTPGQ